MKNINWNGGAKKRLRTLYQENGVFNHISEKNTAKINKKIYQNKGIFQKKAKKLYFSRK